MPPKFDSEEILENLRSGIYTLVNPEGNKRAACWEYFKAIKNDKDEILFGLAACKQCKNCVISYKYIGSSNKVEDMGTTNMNGHLKTCKALPEKKCDEANVRQMKLKNVIQFQNITLNKEDKHKFVQSQVLFHSKAIVPFNVASNPAYLKHLQLAFDLGAKYGKIPIKNVIGSRKLLSKRTLELSGSIQSDLKSRIRPAISDKSVSFTTDLWTDNVIGMWNLHKLLIII